METFLLCLVQLADVIFGHFNLLFSFVASEFFAFAAFISDCFVALIVDVTSILLSKIVYNTKFFGNFVGGHLSMPTFPYATCFPIREDAPD
jgi:hypothetical protein